MADSSLACPSTPHGRDGKRLDLVLVSSSISQTLAQVLCAREVSHLRLPSPHFTGALALFVICCPREVYGSCREDGSSPCLRAAAALGGQTLLRPSAICALCFPVLLATARSFTQFCHPTKGLMTRQRQIDLIIRRMVLSPGRDEGPHHGGAG
jgi:hypothetical protein